MYRTLFIVVFMVMTGIVFIWAVHAAPLQGQDHRHGQSRDWSVRIGALGIHTPAFEGSDDYKVRAFPLIDVTVREEFF